MILPRGYRPLWLAAAVWLSDPGSAQEFPIGVWFPGMTVGDTEAEWASRLDSVKAAGFNTVNAYRGPGKFRTSAYNQKWMALAQARGLQVELGSWKQPPQWREHSRNYWARTYEAEDAELFAYPIGRQVTDGPRVARQARAGVDSPGLLLDSKKSLYLRRNDTARFGHHFFWLKTDDVTGADHLATIRVLRRSDRAVMDSMEVFEDDFDAANTYQDFNLEYTVAGAPGTFAVRYQVHWTGAGNLWVDFVRAHDFEINPDNGDTLRPPHGPHAARLFRGDFDQDLADTLATYYDDPSVDPPWRFLLYDEPRWELNESVAYVDALIREAEEKHGGQARGGISPYNQAVEDAMELYVDTVDPPELLVDYYPFTSSTTTTAAALGTLKDQFGVARTVSLARGIPLWCIVQAFKTGSTSWRDPTPAEIRAQVHLALAHGATGIYYYLYQSYLRYPEDGSVDTVKGLVDLSYRRTPKLTAAEAVNAKLAALSPTLLALTSKHVFPGSSPTDFVHSVSPSADVFAGTFTHDDGSRYLLLVNERCGASDTRSVTVSLSASALHGAGIPYVATDVYTGVSSVTGRGAYPSFALSLAPGDGALVRVAPQPIVGRSSVSFPENGIDTVAAYTSPHSVSWSLSGADADSLRIDGSGRLWFRTSPDYEAPGDADADSVYQVTVEAAAGAQSWSQPVSVRVTDVNEPPVVTCKGGPYPIEIEKGMIAVSCSAHDPEKDLVTWSLAGPDSSAFRFYTGSRMLWFSVSRAPPDVDGDDLYHVQVVATDDGTPAAVGTLDVTVKVIDPPPPELTIAGPDSVFFAEGDTAAVAVYTATGGGSAPVAWSKDGTDAGDFTLGDSTGVLRFAPKPPDYETPTDSDGDNVYTVRVQAADGALSDTLTVTVTVTNRPEAGLLTLSPSSPRVGDTIAAQLIDFDGGVHDTVWTWTALGGSPAGSTYPSIRRSERPVTAADLGKKLRATVAYADNAGSSQSAQATSPPVQPAPPVDPPPVDRPGQVTWSSTSPQVGVALTATLTDADGGIQSARWWVTTVSAAAEAPGPPPLSDPAWTATEQATFTYTPKASEVGKGLKVSVSYRDSLSTGTSLDKHAASAPTGPVQAADRPGTVTFSPAAPRVGDQLTAQLHDPDGGVKNDNWIWSYAGSVSGDATLDADAESYRYTVTEADLGKKLRASVSYDDAHGPGKSAAGTTPPVQAAPPPVDRPGQVTWSSTSPQVGVELTATLTDADGGIQSARWWVTTGTPPSSEAWILTEQATFAYTPKASEIGLTLKASVAYRDSLSGTTIVYASSDPTGPVIGTPGAPQGVGTARVNGSIQVSWSAAPAHGAPILRYEVDDRDTGDGWTSVGLKTLYTKTGIDAAATYTFAVRAENEAGYGPSVEVTSTPGPGGNQPGAKLLAALATGPEQLALAAAPNPFNPETTLYVQLPEPARVALAVYNVAGQPVQVLAAGPSWPAGVHAVVWDGRDSSGQPAASGLYLVRLEAGGQVLHRKIALLR